MPSNYIFVQSTENVLLGDDGPHKSGKGRCKIFQVRLSYQDLEIEPSSERFSGWGTSTTCKNDGNIVLSFICFYGSATNHLGARIWVG